MKQERDKMTSIAKATSESPIQIEYSQESDDVSDYMLPGWIDKENLTVRSAIATVLYDLNRPLTSGQITRILSRVWKPKHLRNVSRELTTETGPLRPRLVRDRAARTFSLTEEGRRWYEEILAPTLQPAGP